METDGIRGQIYCIVDKISNKKYIGMTFNRKDPPNAYINRFKLHINGKGSSKIKKDISSGVTKPEDYHVFLIEDNIMFHEELREKEIYYIKKYNTLYPNGLNLNLGKYIIQTPEIKKQAKETYKRNKKLGLYKKPKNDHKSTFININDKSDKIRTTKDDPRVSSGEYRHPNCSGKPRKIDVLKNKHDEERLLYDGLTKKQHGMKFKNINVTNTEGFKKGRNNFKNRMKTKKFTDKELKYNMRKSIIVKNYWENLNAIDKNKRTSNGLSKINTIEKCKICGIETNKGNIKRWHNEKCKNR